MTQRTSSVAYLKLVKIRAETLARAEIGEMAMTIVLVELGKVVCAQDLMMFSVVSRIIRYHNGDVNRDTQFAQCRFICGI